MSHQSEMDNHANQMNPNNDAYWESRGYDVRGRLNQSFILNIQDQ